LKKFMVALGIFMMSVAGIANAQEVNEQNPYELVQDVANRTLQTARLSASKRTKQRLKLILKCYALLWKKN